MIAFEFHKLESSGISLSRPPCSEIYYLGIIYLVYISVATKFSSLSIVDWSSAFCIVATGYLPSRMSVPNLIITWHPFPILFALKSLWNSYIMFFVWTVVDRGGIFFIDSNVWYFGLRNFLSTKVLYLYGIFRFVILSTNSPGGIILSRVPFYCICNLFWYNHAVLSVHNIGVYMFLHWHALWFSYIFYVDCTLCVSLFKPHHWVSLLRCTICDLIRNFVAFSSMHMCYLNIVVA